MAAMLGADPDRLDDLARRMRDAAAQLQRIERQLTRLVNAQVWVGPAADRYRQEWNSRHRASLGRTGHLLRSAQVRLQLNAWEQREASRAGSGWVSGLAPAVRRVLESVLRQVDMLTGGSWVPPFFLGTIPAPFLLRPGVAVPRMGDLIRLVRIGSDGSSFDLEDWWSASSPEFSAHGAVLEGEVSGSRDLGYGILAAGTAGGSVLAASAGGGASAGIGPTGAHAELHGEAEAVLIEGHAKGRVGNEHLGVEGEAQARAGVDGHGEVEASVGPDGAGAHAGAGGFAGAKASAEVGVDIGGVKPEVRGTVSAGIGAHFDAAMHIDRKSVKVGVDMGATLGLGGGVKWDIEIEPARLMDNTRKAWHSFTPWDD
jgi:uncharacterized protein YukE